MHVRIASLALAAGVALSGAAPSLPTDWQLTLLASGVPGATYVTTPPGEVDRLFITSDGQGIALVDNGVVQPQLFLDLGPQVQASRGLVSMAFHPDYANNGRLFVAYVDASLQNNVVEYQVSASDPNLADPTSATPVVAPFLLEATDHTIDHLAFGPDGMLYVSVGDGIAVDNPDPNPAQDESSLLGKLLRLDVDIPFPHIPADNPFVGVPGARGEIFAMGLRQPWRFSFDHETTRLWLTDVGLSTIEEINVLPLAGIAGTNFGWRCLEGTQCNAHPTCNGLCTGYTDPGFEYTHGMGTGRCAIIGGQVYRGTAIPELAGKFLFSDWCTTEYWTAEVDGQGQVIVEEITDRLVTSDGFNLVAMPAMGRDGNGELLFISRAGGRVYRLDPMPCDSGVSPVCDKSPNSAGPGAQIGPVGSFSIAADDFSLQGRGLPVGQPGLFFYSAGTTDVPFGNGRLCVGGGQTIFRLGPPLFADALGEMLRPLPFSLPPAGSGPGQIFPGSTWNFQLWYRDPAAGGSGFNLSNGFAASFCP